MNAHLSDGRDWLLGDDEPTFADSPGYGYRLSKLPVNDTPLDERFEHLDYYWNRWKGRDSFGRGYADGASGLEELDYLKTR